ncbi:hypothetical protein GCM10022393_24880 [Aquimarina addita]|uniref:TonB-dependent receptor n=1 Tax=Aquimarina addita TaxID=870485 RepID=A0ABP6ULY9_9FLAO
MNHHFCIKYIFIFCFIFSSSLIAQTGTITGTITGILRGPDGLPLSGVSINSENFNAVSISDKKGAYSIYCSVGDILEFTHYGMETKVVKVSLDLFEHGKSMAFNRQEPVTNIYSTAYKKAIQQSTKPTHTVPDIKDSPREYEGPFNFQYNRIKYLEARKDTVALTYFAPDIFYEIGATSNTNFQFVQQKNLPQLQNTYSQGRPSNGQLTYFGPQTGESFSYGPAIASLAYSNTPNIYDQNGTLLPANSNNPGPAKPYDNTLFLTTTKISNRAFFNISTNTNFLGFDYRNERNQDLYGRENSHFNQFEVRYKHQKRNPKKMFWDAFIKYGEVVDNQPNINGFQNNLLLNLWATPASFDIQQGTTLPDNTQRSFSPDQFNNPNWLLEKNRNQTRNNSLIGSLQNNFELSSSVEIKTNLNYTHARNDQRFGLLQNTVGFIEGYSSDKQINNDAFNANLTFSLQENFDGFEIHFTSITDYKYDQLSYSLTENTGFDEVTFTNPITTFTQHQRLTRNTFHLQNKIKYKNYNLHTTVTLANHSFISSIQNTTWFQPSILVRLDLDPIINSSLFSRLFVTASTSFDTNDIPLFYKNQSHNSLLFTPETSFSYTANNDLFITDDVLLEEKQNYELSVDTSINLLHGQFDIDLTYYNNLTKKSVFPVYEQNQFQLDNVADITNQGFEFDLTAYLFKYRELSYTPGIVFSTYRTKVTRILNEKERIPIAGFSTVSKNLIVGQPAGVLVGSAYARNENNEIIIDDEGFPLVATTDKIIGDPIPDFNLGFSNSFTWKRIHLDFLIDFQKGGDIWNGTQNVLNYLGTSQQSALQRNTTGFIFNGVTQQGETNTRPVDFANPNTDVLNNRFVRYGLEGVAEDAIEDGSYLNLKSIQLAYDIKKEDDSHLMREIRIALYGKNLFTWSKFDGASPYSSLFGTTSGRGINFFNTPIISEIGIQLNIKI